MKNTITVPLVIPIDRITNLMATFFESGDPVTRSWLNRVSVRPEHVKVVTAGPWYADTKFWEQPNYTILLSVDRATDDDTGKRFIGPADIIRGLTLLATLRSGIYATQFADILSDNIDSSTADIFMQMVCYGQETYG